MAHLRQGYGGRAKRVPDRSRVADDGTLVCASARAAEYQFATVDRSGRRLETLPIALAPHDAFRPVPFSSETFQRA